MSDSYNKVIATNTVILTQENVDRFTRSQQDIKAYIDIVNALRGNSMFRSTLQLDEIFDKAKRLL